MCFSIKATNIFSKILRSLSHQEFHLLNEIHPLPHSCCLVDTHPHISSCLLYILSNKLDHYNTNTDSILILQNPLNFSLRFCGMPTSKSSSSHLASISSTCFSFLLRFARNSSFSFSFISSSDVYITKINIFFFTYYVSPTSQ